MEIKQIMYFMAVAEQGSYSRAAASLSVSQPALSMAVKKLEEELGVKLFHYFDRKQRLTEEGVKLLDGSKQLVDIYQKTVEEVQNTKESAAGSFTLGLSPLFGACFFGDLIPNFSKAFPNIHIHMIEDGANKINPCIESGEVDIAVTLKTARLSNFSSIHFTTQRNVALLHESHPLANEKGITISALRNDPFAIFNQDFILHQQIMAACRDAGFRPQIALLSSQWDFMVELVAKNRAVSILPKPVLIKHPIPHVTGVLLTDIMKYWDITLAWNKNKYMPHACKLFLSYIQNHLPPDDL